MNKKLENKVVIVTGASKGIGLIVPVMKELAEMNYQYDRDYYFDSSKFNNHFKHTPITHAMAVKQAIEQMSDSKEKTIND